MDYPASKRIVMEDSDLLAGKADGSGTDDALAAKLAKASNLSDLASASTARTNLGLGSAATQPSSAFDPSGAAAGVTPSSLGLGNVDNTADPDKPLSDASTAALDLKVTAASAVVTASASSSPDGIVLIPPALTLTATGGGLLELRALIPGNTSIGANAGRRVTSAGNVTNVGYSAGQSMTTGGNATNVGANAGHNMTTASNSTNIGALAGQSLTSGGNNTNVGRSAGQSMTTGVNATNVGHTAGYNMTTASRCTNVGLAAGFQPKGITANATVAGSNVTAIGHEAGSPDATDPSDLTAVGYRALATSQAASLGSGAEARHQGSVALGYNTVTTAVDQVMVGGRDVEITDAIKGLVGKSPDGIRYRATFANGGTLIVTAA